jgi:hypothetical protein
MKKLKLFCAIVTALLAVSLTGCKPNADEEDFTYDSIGEWMIGDWDIASESTMKMSIQGMPEYDTNETQAIKGTINIEGIEDDSIVTMSYEDGSSDAITFKEFVEENLIPSEETLDEMVSVGGEVSYSCKVNSAKNKITVKMSASVSQEGVEMSVSMNAVMTKK